jgi:hypothetical protein
MIDLCKKIFRSVTRHDTDSFDTTLAQLVDTRLDNGLVAEGKQRFERAHPF